ncbi:MAG: hypothetical protein ACYDHG_17645 [Desulfomonilaceae bacterium]
MSEIDAVPVRKIVRAMAAKELVGRGIIADLLFRIGVIALPTSLQNKKMDLHPFELSLGGLFRGDFDCQLSNNLRKLFPSRLSQISDQLEATWRAESLSTQGNQMAKVGGSSTQDPTRRKKTLVEECFIIDVEQLDQWGILLPHYPRFGFMLLLKTLTGAPLLCMWEINRSENSSHLGLTYLVPNSKKVESSSIEIWRSKMSDKNQAQKHWLKCPHAEEDASRSSHRRLLYLPPNGEKFKCDQCYDLERHRSRSMVGLDLSVPLFFLPPNR